MTQTLQHQPLASLKPVTRCTASYIKELEEVRKLAQRAIDILSIHGIYTADLQLELEEV